MRVFEWSMFLINVILVVSYLKGKKWYENKRYFVLGAYILLFLGHILLESIRWQIYGLYFLNIYMVFIIFSGLKRTKILRAFSYFTLIIVIITLLLLLAFPVNKIPNPTGKYNIGTIVYDLVDENRLEIYGGVTDEQRKIRAQLWYPTDDTEGEIAPWIYDGIGVARGIPSFAGLPSFLLDHTVAIESNSLINASLSDNVSDLPVVIISHGWTSFRSLHTDYAEMLASHGYLVVGVDHPYGAMGTVFEDGTNIKLDSNALPSADKVDNFLEYANVLVNTYSLDSKLVVDNIFELNIGDDILMFRDKIDVNSIGLLGHSTGGGGIVKLALNDERIKAVFGLDPWIEPVKGEVLKKGFDIPAIFIRSNEWEGGNNDTNLALIDNYSANNLDIYQINDSIHQDFSMLYMFNPISKYIGLSGKLDNKLNRTIQQEYILMFFNKTLRNMDNDLIDLLDKYEEVIDVKF